jgi:hypothetical protein
MRTWTHASVASLLVLAVGVATACDEGKSGGKGADSMLATTAGLYRLSVTADGQRSVEYTPKNESVAREIMKDTDPDYAETKLFEVAVDGPVVLEDRYLEIDKDEPAFGWSIFIRGKLLWQAMSQAQPTIMREGKGWVVGTRSEGSNKTAVICNETAVSGADTSEACGSD